MYLHSINRWLQVIGLTLLVVDELDARSVFHTRFTIVRTKTAEMQLEAAIRCCDNLLYGEQPCSSKVRIKTEGSAS